jgi:inner membrane protein
MYDLDRLLSAVRSSVHLGLLGALMLVLLVPIAMIGGLVSERQARYEAAVNEVSGKWGDAQRITGPLLVLPYTAQAGTGDAGEATETRYAVFLPKRLQTVAAVRTESRERGIFSVPVYTLMPSLEGTFDRPELAELGVDPRSVLWSRAHVVLGISDTRAIGDLSTIEWNDEEAGFLPGTAGLVGSMPGIHAPVAVSPDDSEFGFSLSLSLNGSRGVYFGPFAEETTVRLTSNSSDPSFQGDWLPAERTVSDEGFEAVWRVSYLGRNYPQAWIASSDYQQAIEASRFGVELGSPVDQYRMADRSVKYAALFILLTFVVVWLIEVLAAVRVHPIQYLMLGAALCLFYLLELSLAEHIGFRLAYTIASLSIIVMVASYGRAVFRSWHRGAFVATSVTLLYGCLFVLLTNEDAALLIGSVGLFVVLAIVMFATRKIDWYAGVGEQPAPESVE